jgi:uncharacterized protein
LLKITNATDLLNLYSFEIKRELSSDYDLKKHYFQAVSNSSWSNYGYLVALEIKSSLLDEIERLNQSFGIGVIELNSNPFKSRILYQAKHKSLDFKTIDKLSKINPEFNTFIEHVNNLLKAEDNFLPAIKKQLYEYCDQYFENDDEIKRYCEEKNIPYKKDKELLDVIDGLILLAKDGNSKNYDKEILKLIKNLSADLSG